MRGVRIIPLCGLLNREVRTFAYYPTHNQKFKTLDDFKKLWEFTIKHETEIEHGFDVDTFIVLNEECEGLEEGVRKTKNGNLYIIKGENFGKSFGAFNQVFQKYKDEYDYWLFGEDDIIVLGDSYFKKCVDRFNSEPNIGFLALAGVNSTNPRIHAHSATGLTSREILKKVCEVNGGGLPCPKSAKKHFDLIEYGEIPFTNEIYKLGYRLVEYGTREWGEHNLIIPYYDICKKK